MMAETTTTYFFKRGIMKLPEQWGWCIEVQGEYIEK
jgi:hypothetical protein